MFSDPEIRKLLLPELSSHHDGGQNLVIEELGLNRGDARIDVALVNGALSGYEIKSERDSLRRLKNQICIYSQVLDFVTVVAATRHLSPLERWLPSWWGITVVDPKSRALRVVRPAEQNQCIRPASLVQLLWRKEALKFLERIGSGILRQRATKSQIWSQILNTASVDEIRTEVRSALASRQNWRNSHLAPASCFTTNST